MNKKKIGCVIALLAIIWGIRYVTLNGGIGVQLNHPRENYQIGEVISFDDNMSGGKNYYKGYTICLDSYKAYETKEYLDMIHKTDNDFSFPLGDITLELTVTLTNNNADFSVKSDESEYTFEDSVDLMGSFFITGSDWYEFMNRELTAYANPIFEDDPNKSPYIVILPDEPYQIKLVYNLEQKTMSNRRWKNILNEDMAFLVTLNPIEKRIELKY